MARATEPPVVKLICGMISASTDMLDRASDRLEQVFGKIDLTSKTMNFDFTHYYDEQMGSPLYRRFVSFAHCIRPDALVDAKWTTNAIEQDLAVQSTPPPTRPINLDPGYLGLSKLVLGSMKNFSHRIYLARKVFAEVTLIYQGGQWTPLPWTFPDYASGRYHGFLTKVRERLGDQLKKDKET